MSLSTEQPNTCELDTNLALLRGNPLFASLPLEAQRAYAYLCKRVHYQTGEFVFRQGYTDNQAYILMEGQLEIIRENENIEQVYGTFIQEELIGSLALLANVRRLFSLRAVERSTCLLLPRKKLLTESSNNPEVAHAFVTAITERIITWEEKMLHNATDIPQTAGISLL